MQFNERAVKFTDQKSSRRFVRSDEEAACGVKAMNFNECTVNFNAIA